MINKFIFTCGDINGIGPEIIIKTLNSVIGKTFNIFYIACPKNVFIDTSLKIRPRFKFKIISKYEEDPECQVFIIDIGNKKYRYGKATSISGRTSFNSIKTAFKLANEKKVDAIITAPISKHALHLAKVNYPGHTEMLADWSKSKNFVMAFLSNKMNAAIVTIHQPIKNIPRLITKTAVKTKIDAAIQMLKYDLHIEEPKVAVLGLNPHAGEEGIIGKEEEKIIKPLISSYKNKNVSGPFSPDAFFGSGKYKEYNLILGMYHDQVLIPFKLLNFGKGVNYTAGLPFVRTSPDHGVAYDIAGKDIADESSLIEAYLYADKIVQNRKENGLRKSN